MKNITIKSKDGLDYCVIEFLEKSIKIMPVIDNAGNTFRLSYERIFRCRQ